MALQFDINIYPLPKHEYLNELVIHPCKNINNNPEDTQVERCSKEEAHFFSVYGYMKGHYYNGDICIADCRTEEIAENYKKFLLEFYAMMRFSKNTLYDPSKNK